MEGLNLANAPKWGRRSCSKNRGLTRANADLYTIGGLMVGVWFGGVCPSQVARRVGFEIADFLVSDFGIDRYGRRREQLGVDKE